MKYFILFVLFFASCNNKQNNNSTKLSNDLITLNTADKINIDSVLSLVAQGQCVCVGPTGLEGHRTPEFEAYEITDKVMTNEQLYALLKNKNPKIRFAAINILHHRDDTKLFYEGAKLLASDTSLVCSASGCSPIELPLKEHIKFLETQKN